MRRETNIAIIGAIVAVLLQIVLSPNIAIFSAMPNILIIYVLVVAMLMPGDAVFVIAFLMGLMSDLLGYGPVGALPFLLLIASFAAMRAIAVFDNDTLFVSLAILFILTLLVEFFYAAFVLSMSSSIGPIDAFLYRALPCTLYDCVFGLLLYPVMSHFLVATHATMGSSTPSPRLR